MISTIEHRGPDGTSFLDDEHCTLGFARLAVIDLETGMQPVHNETGTIQLVMNGEIYNYRQLREDLETQGHRFYTQSDSETVVHCYEEYGSDFPKYLEGMFAIALWDSQKKRIALVRDRIGIKPLYYAVINGELIFASEIKAILQHPSVSIEINKNAVSQFIAYRFAWMPETIFAGVWRLPPAHLLSFSLTDSKFDLQRYWELETIDFGSDSADQLVTKLTALLETSVKSHMVSDVPLGAFLSGGLDSSLVVALMSKVSPMPIDTFTVGFDGFKYDEKPFAEQVADYFSTNHHTLSIDSRSAIHLPNVIWNMEEPIADPAAIPTYELARFAKNRCSVVLTGEGGDEVFAGYEHYQYARKSSSYLRPFPLGVRKGIIGPIVQKLPVAVLSQLSEYMSELGPDARDRVSFVISHSDSADQMYSGMVRIFSENEMRLLLREKSWNMSGLAYQTNSKATEPDIVTQYQVREIGSSLPENLLMKVDKTTSAFGLEARVPYLQHDLVSFGISLPVGMKLSRSGGKVALRHVASKFLPRAIRERRKQRFFVPIHYWLSGEGNDTLSQIIDDCCKLPYFDPEVVRDIAAKAMSRHLYQARQIWNLITFTIWHSTFIENRARSPIEL